MPRFLYQKTTGRIYEVLAQDQAAGTITLKNDMASFTDTFDPQRLVQQGFIKVTGDDADDATAKAQAKLAQLEDEEAA